MDTLYNVLAVLIKLVLGISLLLLAWSFCLWLYLVYVFTENLFVWFLLLLNVVLTSYYLIWELNTHITKNNTFSQLFSLAVCIGTIYIMYCMNGSSLWVFEVLTTILSHFTGTISYMFNHTLQSVEILKAAGYVGCGILILWITLAGYNWSLDFYERFLEK